MLDNHSPLFSHSIKHYNKIWKNIISYLWRIHLKNRLIMDYLIEHATDEIKTLIEEAESEILEAFEEEGGEQ